MSISPQPCQHLSVFKKKKKSFWHVWDDISFWFWFTFPWWLTMSSIFHIPIGHLCVFFREMSIQALGQFFNWVIRFWNVFFLSCRRSLFVWQLIPYKICASLLFHSVDVSFGLKKLFSLIYSHLSIFALLPVLLTSYPWNHEAMCFYFLMKLSHI